MIYFCFVLFLINHLLLWKIKWSEFHQYFLIRHKKTKCGILTWKTRSFYTMPTLEKEKGSFSFEEGDKNL